MAFVSTAQRLIPKTGIPSLDTWVESVVYQTRPKSVEIIDGSIEQYQALCTTLLEKKTFIRLNQELRPNSFLARSNPEDVARVEERTFTCTKSKEEAGPTNNWVDPSEMRNRLNSLLDGAMEGRTMYVVPFCMGPVGSSFSRYGVEITDSAYVAASLFLMTRLGVDVLRQLSVQPYYVKCLHSVGCPLLPGQEDVSWPCNPEEQYIVQFPETMEVVSFGSGYGGNALLNKKCFALRIASWLGLKEGWLAEHMLLIGVTNPKGEKKYIAASFPSACGKTNLAMLSPKLEGWKVECVGDDISWLFWDKNGVLRAVNPEAGFFGVAPGTSMESNPVAMKTIQHDTIFTNVGLSPEGDVFWEGMDNMPQEGISWLGAPWTRDASLKAAQPNARFTVKVDQCPTLDSAWNSPEGVPVSAILFGGRRSALVPLVREARSWEEGVLYGAMMSSETTAAAKGSIGALRHDPFAMLPFCGYNMGDYFNHWLDFAQDSKKSSKKPSNKKLPRIYAVNWFRKKSDGSFAWPGFGDNIRVIEWIFNRLEQQVKAIESPIGNIPCEADLNLEGLKCSYSDLFSFDRDLWKKEVTGLVDYFAKFQSHFPAALHNELHKLELNLS